jgi:hypothetical protein
MVVALVAVASGACGGSVASPIDDGGTSTDGNVSDTGIKDSGTSSKCPATLPTNQSSCALPEGFRCEYGTSSNTMCNTLATCTQGQWQVLLTGAFPQECSGTNPPACAPTFASVPVGQSCSKDYPTSCEYPEGICACTVDLNGPYPVDAAAVAKWYCGVPQQKECPVPRPKLGTDCNVGPNVVCDYGACILPGGAVLQCQNGSWQDAMYGCPD